MGNNPTISHEDLEFIRKLDDPDLIALINETNNNGWISGSMLLLKMMRNPKYIDVPETSGNDAEN